MIPLKKWFSKHENKAKFNNLDDSGVPSSNFPGLRISLCQGQIKKKHFALGHCVGRFP